MRLFTSFLTCFLVLLFFSCKQKDLDKLNNTSLFKKEINSYGPLSLSKQGEIYIDFKEEVFPEVDETTIAKFFSIEPYIKTTSYVKNGRVIVIDPVSELKSNQQYNIQFDINRFLNKSKLRTDKMEFSVTVIPQFASLSFKDYVFFDGEWYLDVQLNLNDQESLEKLKELTTVEREGKKIDFDYLIEDPRKPVIRVQGINPSEKEGKIRIEFNGKPIGASASSTYEFIVPQKEELRLLKTTEVIENKTITFIFNKELDKQQNLDGLISVTGTTKVPTYKIKSNALTVFYEQSSEVQTVTLKKGIKAEDGKKLNALAEHILGKTKINPKVENVGIGHIIPTDNEVVFPFEAVGLKKVRLQIFKVHSQNLQQFYQRNTLASNYQLEYVGEVVHNEVIDLTSLTDSYDPYEMNRYHFNLKNFIETDASAAYEVRLGFLPEDVVMDCEALLDFPEKEIHFNNSYYGIYGYYPEFDYQDRENPCKPAYYNEDNYARKMVLNSSIGIIAKKTNKGDVIVFANDINTTQPISGAGVFVYNLSQRELINTMTDGEGRAFIEDIPEACMIKVKLGNKENWLRIKDNEGLNLSKFRVDGRVTKNGLDGFLYSERNVWRPGDSMFVDFIVHDPNEKIPDNHPVTLKLFNPQGKEVFEETSIDNLGSFYSFTIPTKTAFVTGDYLLKATLGANNFTKSVKIETIKPNKFAITNNVEEGKTLSKEIRSNQAKIFYEVKWLYGSPAKNKKVKVELDVNRSFINWDGYKDYQFENPKNSFNPPSNTLVAEGNTDENGRLEVPLKLPDGILPPSLLTLKLKTTAYETGGDFSTDVSRINYSPYSHYVGIEIPRNEYNYKRVDKGKNARINFVSLDEDQQVANGRLLEVNIYKMKNSWWYSSYDDRFVMDNNDIHMSQSNFQIVSSANGTSSIDVSFNTYGRYFVKIKDKNSGHVTADYLYVGHPWNDDGMSMAVYEEAAQLNFDATSSSYKTGETVELNVPSYFDGKALVSLENGSTVVESFWTKVQRGSNKITFTAQQTMFPTIYAHVTLLQAHEDKVTDMPIRSYGVVPIQVEDDRLMLNPEIQVADELKPKESYKISVKEESGKAMHYTIAVVDEGLLNITNFQSPDPFSHFYSKPALGVRTFDMYNDVMSNYGRNIDQLFSIGGDGQLAKADNVEKANRFKSVVKHLGPFLLEAGAQNEHKIQMPNYIGNVRFMLVAAKDGQYGMDEKNVPVKQDLMVLTTLPRTLAPGDQLDVPLTIFTMKKGLGEVGYRLQTNGVDVAISNDNGSFVSSLDEEKVLTLKANIGEEEGVAKFFSSANAGALTSTQEIEVQVENPNPIIRRTGSYYLEPQSSEEYALDPIGKHDSEYSISISSLAPVNMEETIDMLTRYPYGCLEQRTSAAYAYIYQQELAPDMASPEYARGMVTSHLGELYRFKQSSGYSLWPGSRRYDSWLTSFVGDFLVDANEKGFGVSQDLLNSWINDQKSIAANWTPSVKIGQYADQNSRIFDQAYRLYTLAKSNNPAISEMNRLREDFELEYNSGLLLAAAYAEAGRTDIAEDVYSSLDASNVGEINYYRSYGSRLRNIALAIILHSKLGKRDEVAKGMINLNDELKRNSYMSTHTSVFVLRAISVVASSTGFSKDLSVGVTSNGNTSDLTSGNGQLYLEGELKSKRKISLENKSPHGVYVEVVRRAKEDIGKEKADSETIEVKTKYVGEDGKILDVTEIQQGTDFTMVTVVSRSKTGSGPNLDNLALRQAIPSGWEIVNDRINGFGDGISSKLQYQDIRDSKVHSFFSLEGQNQVEVRIKLKATYSGSFYHPKVLAESMYNHQVYAEERGFATTVTPSF